MAHLVATHKSALQHLSFGHSTLALCICAVRLDDRRPAAAVDRAVSISVRIVQRLL